MLRIAICDDEAVMCGILKDKVTEQMRELAGPFEIVCYTDVSGLLETEVNFDIFLLDIQMPGMNGMDFARKLRDKNCHSAIIFITVLKENVFDAFEVEAVDYLCKPVDELRLKNALRRALNYRKKPDDGVLVVQTMNWCKTIKLGSIYYCEVINRKLYLHTVHGVVEYYSKLGEIEKQLDYRFVKCHRSYIVNLDYLYEYAEGQITLENGERIPVSRSQKKIVMESMLQYMKKGE